jgi:hypothetical protein
MDDIVGNYKQPKEGYALTRKTNILNSFQFLVGNRLSLADVELAVDLAPAFCSDPPLVSDLQTFIQS